MDSTPPPLPFYFTRYARDLRPKFSNFFELGHPILKEPPSTPLSKKLWNNNRTVHMNERNQKKNKTKSRNIQTDHAFYYSI